MGVSMFGRCYTNPVAKAPNPNPSRWQLLGLSQFDHACVVTAKYLDCTNFEGVKIMVFRGKWSPRDRLDPHFSEGPDSPIARFRPDRAGHVMAAALAASIGPEGT